MSGSGSDARCLFMWFFVCLFFRMLCDFLLKGRHDVMDKGTEVCKPLMGCFVLIWLKVLLHLLFAMAMVAEAKKFPLGSLFWSPLLSLGFLDSGVVTQSSQVFHKPSFLGVSKWDEHLNL